MQDRTGYHVEVTPNPGPEPDRFVAVHWGGVPVVYPSRAAAEAVGRSLEALALGTLKCPVWRFRIVEARPHG